MLSCRNVSLLCALALGAAEVAAARGAPVGLLATARLFLLCVWARCWSGAASAGKAGGGILWGPRCSDEPTTAAAREAAGLLVHNGAKHARRTWRSAAVQLPEPGLVVNLLKSRRSVFCKDMTPGRPLDPATLSMLLEAASWAPSHARTEPWHFVAFQSAESRAALAALSVALVRLEKGEQAAAAVEEEFQPGKRWANASCLIAICMRRIPRGYTADGQPKFNPEWEEVSAVACAVQNMHLMATALPGGVCGYWSSWYECVRDAPEMHQMLGLSPGDRCLGFFVLGHCQQVGDFRASRRPPSADVR